MTSESVSPVMSEWIRSLPLPERMRALALMYSHLTVATRGLLLPETVNGKERVVLELLRGVNELHHTLANSFLRWGDGEVDWTPEDLSQQLLEIAVQFHLVDLLKSSMEFAQTRAPQARPGQ